MDGRKCCSAAVAWQPLTTGWAAGCAQVTTDRVVTLTLPPPLPRATQDPYCTPRVEDALDAQGWAGAAARADAGTTPRHLELERLIADFLVRLCRVGSACRQGMAVLGA